MWLISDDLQITKKSVQKALDDKDKRAVQSLVETICKSCADAIDINTGPLGRDASLKMKFFVDAVQEVTDLPLVIDTANPVAMRAGLECAKEKAIINGFSLEPKKLEMILPLAEEFDTDIMGYLLTPESHVPSSLSERVSIALEIHSRLVEAGVDEKRLIIDPVLSPLIWDDGKKRNQDLLEIIRLLPEMLGYNVRTVVGLSNLTTGMKKDESTERIEKIFLSMLAANGLSMVLLNSSNENVLKYAGTIKTLLDDSVFSLASI